MTHFRFFFKRKSLAHTAFHAGHVGSRKIMSIAGLITANNVKTMKRIFKSYGNKLTLVQFVTAMQVCIDKHKINSDEIEFAKEMIELYKQIDEFDQESFSNIFRNIMNEYEKSRIQKNKIDSAFIQRLYTSLDLSIAVEDTNLNKGLSFSSLIILGTMLNFKDFIAKLCAVSASNLKISDLIFENII